MQTTTLARRERAAFRDRALDRLAVAALYLFVIGTMVFRRRSGADIAQDAVDGAASFRIAFDALALACALLVITNRLSQRVPKSETAPAPLLMYFAYAAVVAVGGVVAVSPGLVAFRAFELLVITFVAWAVMWRCNLRRTLWHVHAILWLFIVLIVVGLVVSPSEALWPQRSGPIPFRLQGGFPLMAANTVGFIGVMLLPFAFERGRKTPLRWLDGGAAILLIVLSQYRTGYVICAAIIVTILIARPGFRSKGLLVLLVPAGIALVASSAFTSLWDRGEQTTDTLSGRTEIWADAFRIANQSPIIGTGLSSGFRYEVVPQLNKYFSADISSAHSTWVEAFLGTGYIGTVLIAAMYLISIVIAWRVRSISVLPIALVAALLTRSITASTIELPSWPALALVVVIAASSACHRGRQESSPTLNDAPLEARDVRR